MTVSVIIMIDISIIKIIKILKFNCMLIADIVSKCLKKLIKLYITQLSVLKLINVICIHILIQFQILHMIIRMCM